MKKKTIYAIAICSVGGFWVGLLGRLMLGSMPVSLSTLGYWAIGSVVVGVILGVIFPRAVSVVLYRFSFLGVGGS